MGGSFSLFGVRLNGAGNALAAHARGACFHGLVRTANINFHRLQIRQPAALGFVHRVADIIAGFRPLATDFTALRHLNRSLQTKLGWQPSAGGAIQTTRR